MLGGSIITAYNSEYEFLFYVESMATLKMNNSILSECGYSWNYPGLVINGEATIENCTIKNNYLFYFMIGVRI